MKKFYLFLMMFLAVGLTACGGDSKEGAKDGEKTEASKDGEKTEASKDGNNIDAILDEYEEYVDKTIDVVKKVKAGDMNVMADYTELTQKAASLAEKCEKNKDDMTEEQTERLAKLAEKLAKAAQEMQ